MSIIIQTGHSSSYSGRLMQMLYECGLNAPIASLMHELSASDISVKLATALSKSNSVINAKLIDNLIVDLLLANLDWDDWGWESEYNLDALSYWQQSDDNIRFILVFDSPKLLLKQLLGQNITPESVEEAIRTWIAYHQKLLKFFRENTNRCLLIEGNIAIHNLSDFKECIQTIAPNLKLKKEWQVRKFDCQEMNNDPLFGLVVGEICKQYPECLSLYNSLVKESAIYLKDHQAVNDELTDPVLLFMALNQQEISKSRILSDYASLKNQMSALILKNQHLEQENKTNRAECQTQREKACSAESRLELLQADIKHLRKNQTVVGNVQQENELLIGQLHQMRRELDRVFADNQRCRSSNSDMSKQPMYGAANRIKDDLPYRLGSLIIKRSKSISGLTTLPFVLIKEYREFSNKQSDNLPAIENYQDADEAEKIKKHLSYRLGKVLVDGIKSKKVIGLPIKMGREIVEFKK